MTPDQTHHCPLGRRTLLTGIAVMLGGVAIGPAALAAGKSTTGLGARTVRLPTLTIPGQGAFGLAMIEVDLLVKAGDDIATDMSLVFDQRPRITGRIATVIVDEKLVARKNPPSAVAHLKDRIRTIANQALMEGGAKALVEEVFIVQLLVS